MGLRVRQTLAEIIAINFEALKLNARKGFDFNVCRKQWTGREDIETQPFPKASINR
jgi:hypothetical protein